MLRPYSSEIQFSWIFRFIIREGCFNVIKVELKVLIHWVIQEVHEIRYKDSVKWSLVTGVRNRSRMTVCVQLESRKRSLFCYQVVVFWCQFTVWLYYWNPEEACRHVHKWSLSSKLWREWDLGEWFLDGVYIKPWVWIEHLISWDAFLQVLG